MNLETLLKELLSITGLGQERLAEEIGISQATFSRLLNGKTDVRQSTVEKIKSYASNKGVLPTQPREGKLTHDIPIRGVVGLGDAISWHGDGDVYLGEVDFPLRLPEGCVALEARGNSQFPRIKDGELVIVRPVDTEPSEMIGEEVVVKVLNGPYLLKTLRRGYEQGHFTLETHNGPPVENVEVEWAAELWAIIPSRRWRRLG